MFGPEYEEWVDLLGELRPEITTRFPDPEERKAAWYRVVDSNCVAAIKEGARPAEVRDRVEELLG
jgi:siroheme synthase (precorrin-2 oxidase/ferrochelatase)